LLQTVARHQLIFGSSRSQISVSHHLHCLPPLSKVASAIGIPCPGLGTSVSPLRSTVIHRPRYSTLLSSLTSRTPIMTGPRSQYTQADSGSLAACPLHEAIDGNSIIGSRGEQTAETSSHDDQVRDLCVGEFNTLEVRISVAAGHDWCEEEHVSHQHASRSANAGVERSQKLRPTRRYWDIADEGFHGVLLTSLLERQAAAWYEYKRQVSQTPLTES